MASSSLIVFAALLTSAIAAPQLPVLGSGVSTGFITYGTASQPNESTSHVRRISTGLHNTADALQIASPAETVEFPRREDKTAFTRASKRSDDRQTEWPAWFPWADIPHARQAAGPAARARAAVGVSTSPPTLSDPLVPLHSSTSTLLPLPPPSATAPEASLTQSSSGGGGEGPGPLTTSISTGGALPPPIPWDSSISGTLTMVSLYIKLVSLLRRESRRRLT